MATRTHQGDVQHDYDALLIFSAQDEDLAKALWETLKRRGYRITQHQDPDGPFKIGRSAYDNMINAIERSKKLLVLFTKAAVDSGFVSLEMMLGIEKSRRTGRMGLQLLAVGLSQEEVGSLKHGLLGVVPHIPVDMNRERWDEILLDKLREPRERMDDLLPAGNLAHGQVFSHFVGYLQHILPVLEGKLLEWKESSDHYRQNPGKLCCKYIMLIPHSCNTEISIDCDYPDCDVTIEFVDRLTISIVHGEKNREYNPTIYRASKGRSSEPIYFIGEYANVLHCAWMLKDRKIASVDTRLEANRFYHTMNNLLNHKENSRCNDKAKLLCYSDSQVSTGCVLWQALIQEIQGEQQGDAGACHILSCFNSLRASTEKYEYMNDATVTCLSPTLEDRNVAEGIATFLERHDKKVVCRDALQGTLAELDTAQWNIFVMSQDSFNREFIGIELISSIERCAQNKCIQILPVITGMRMEEVPDSLKWVTMISTEQDNYKQIILYQIEGMPVHMHQKMPAGDVSTGLAWAYLLNYLPIQLNETTREGGLDFEGRIKKHLEDKLKNCGCLPYFYVVLSSTGEVVKDDITNLGRAGPPIKKHQAGVKDRQYYINMFQYRFPDTQQEVCFISEACTPGITLNTMANDLQFAGIEPGHILKGQIQNLADVIETRLRDPHYIKVMGDFRDRFRLIRYDVDAGRKLSDVIGEHLRADLTPSALIHPDNRMDTLD